MKHKGCISDFKRERNRDLLTAYRKLIAEKPFIDARKVFAELVKMPSSRFWVSEERAAIVIAQIMNGDKLESMLPNKRRMFFELYRRAKKIMSNHPEMTLGEIANQIVVQPAPEFYLTPNSAMVILFYEKREWYKQRRKQLKHLFY